MTRNDEIQEMAKSYASHMTSDKDMQVAFADALRRGAEWADAHPKQIEISLEDIEELAKEVIPEDWVERQETLWDMIRRNQRAQFITKACEWLEEFMQMTPSKKTFIKRFEQAMKGE